MMSRELRGTMECPVCGWAEPHSHTQNEIAERPFIDGARITFEKEAREFMAGPYFKGPRTGFWWAYEAEAARRTDEGKFHGWAQRAYPSGPYLNEFVEVMWRFWRTAWLAARRPADGSVGDTRISTEDSEDDALRPVPEEASGARATGAEPSDPARQLHYLSPEERASMFIDWCALSGFGLQGWPEGAFEQLVGHMAGGEAGTAETRSGSVHEHAVAEGDAPSPSPSSSP